MGRLARCEQGTAVGAAIGVMVFGMIAAGAALAVDGVTDYGAALVEAAEAAQAAAEAARDEAIAACVAAGGTGCG